MSFSRISLVALALAAGLAAPASAATWKIDFFNPLNSNVGSGTFTADVPTVSAPQFPTDFNVTVNGINYLPIDGLSVRQFSLFEGELVVIFALFKESTVLDNILTATATKLTNGPVVKSWLTADCSIDDLETEDQECDTVGGTYTLTRLQDGDPNPPPVIPLPASAALLPLGLVALGALRRRRKD
jgi:hypothetical protein